MFLIFTLEKRVTFSFFFISQFFFKSHIEVLSWNLAVFFLLNSVPFGIFSKVILVTNAWNL